MWDKMKEEESSSIRELRYSARKQAKEVILRQVTDMDLLSEDLGDLIWVMDNMHKIMAIKGLITQINIPNNKTEE